MSVHKDLTGADLHEPKGADTATSGKVYVSDGSGSGAWTDASTIITNTAFTTGDLKLTHKETADTGWIMWSDGTIGDGSSSATIRANADTSALFTLYWTRNYTGINISGGRGASAAADFAAHKRLNLPPGAGRALVLAGAGSGLTTRSMAETTGAETYTIVTANLPAYTPSGSIVSTLTGTVTLANTAGGSVNGLVRGDSIGTNTFSNFHDVAISSTFTGTAQGGSSTAHTIMQPSTFVNAMVKL